tara:strand:- start:215 stop:481 length:267 start_codon:yes stop_codon:yes gene_type:complete
MDDTTINTLKHVRKSFETIKDLCDESIRCKNIEKQNIYSASILLQLYLGSKDNDNEEATKIFKENYLKQCETLEDNEEWEKLVQQFTT